MKQARGDVRQIIIGMYQTLERAGARDIVSRVRKGARAMGYAFSDHQCTEWLKPFQNGRARETHENRTENAPGFGHESHGNRTENARETHSRANKESLVTKSLSPPVAKATMPPHRGPVVKVDVPEVTFGDEADERRVAALLALQNPSGRMTDSKRLALRGVMHATLAEVGVAAWRFGVDAAIAKGAGWPYAARVIVNNPTPPAAQLGGPVRGSPGTNGRRSTIAPVPEDWLAAAKAKIAQGAS